MSSFYASSSDTEASIAAHRGRGDGFFAHHGPWALGVRLFRSLNFPAKASLISVVFLFPLVVLCFAYVGTSQEQINFARQERVGVAVLKAVEPWVIEVQKQRRLTLTAQRDTPDLAAIEEKLVVVRKAIGDSGIDLGEELRAAEALHAATNSVDGKSAEGVAKLQAYVDASMALRSALLDKSNLTLDPDQDTYYLMTLASDATSDVIEAISRSRAVAGRLGRLEGPNLTLPAFPGSHS